MGSTDSYGSRRDLPIFVHPELEDLGLKSQTFRVYACLASHAGYGEVSLSYSEIGEACFEADLPKAKPETWRRMAITAVKELVGLGLIRKEKYIARSGDYTANTYMLTSRSEWCDYGSDGVFKLGANWNRWFS